LSAPIPAADGIGFFPVAAANTQNSFLSLPLLAYGQNVSYVNPANGMTSPHLGRNNIDAIGLLSFDGPTPINEATMAYAFDYNATRFGEIHLIGGDSGAPSFIPVPGSATQLALVGAHYGLDPNTLTSADSFLPFYVSQLNAFMAPTGFSVTLAQVPEPTALALTGLAAAAGAVRWRRRRKAA
jgi:hypothetical protein